MCIIQTVDVNRCNIYDCIPKMNFLPYERVLSFLPSVAKDKYVRLMVKIVLLETYILGEGKYSYGEKLDQSLIDKGGMRILMPMINIYSGTETSRIILAYTVFRAMGDISWEIASLNEFIFLISGNIVLVSPSRRTPIHSDIHESVVCAPQQLIHTVMVDYGGRLTVDTRVLSHDAASAENRLVVARMLQRGANIRELAKKLTLNDIAKAYIERSVLAIRVLEVYKLILENLRQPRCI